MRLLVCGNRDWTDSGEIAYHLALIFGTERDRLVIHGNNGNLLAKPPRGADVLAGWCAAGVGAAVDTYAVDRRLDGQWPNAGPRRNARMLRESKPDRGLAFGALWKPGSPPEREVQPGLFERKSCVVWEHTGTGGMIALMLGAGIPVRWVPAPGHEYIDLVEMPQPLFPRRP